MVRDTQHSAMSGPRQDEHEVELNKDEGLTVPGVSIFPRTIQDAMTVTKLLELRYLWVDKHCIDQENRQDKHEQINQMDMIYTEERMSLLLPQPVKMRMLGCQESVTQQEKLSLLFL
jgi:hypothetical protein